MMMMMISDTCFDLAREKGHSQIVALLEEHAYAPGSWNLSDAVLACMQNKERVVNRSRGRV